MKGQMMVSLTTALAAMMLMIMMNPSLVSARDYSDLPGPFCEARRGGCCNGRQDDCSAPIYGTLCYCDDFCNRTTNEDCCPDFWSFCKGVTPPPQPTRRCYYNGRYYNFGQTAKINCNECKCQQSPVNPNVVEFLCERNLCMIDTEIINGVNAAPQGWRASNYTMFWGRRLDEGLQLRLGTLQPERLVLNMIPVKTTFDPKRLPRSFDARTKWRRWIQPVKDQGWCGSSWAVSTTTVASDRFAIMSEGLENIDLSAQHLLSCNSRGQQACHGGHLDRAWIFLRKVGIVDENCYPYTSGTTGVAGKCFITRRAVRQRNFRCVSGHGQTELHKTGPAYRLGSEQDIMNEVMESGPVQATMRVYRDFFMYRGGVYHAYPATVAERTGYHSVRIIGWGEDTTQGYPIKYWLVANSWGTNWGENGYFRIRRGTNECEIEDFVLASWAHTDNQPSRRNHDNRLNNI